ncbi:MAG: lamin tail domain-containing protein, partial [Balneolaceae bacterium]
MRFILLTAIVSLFYNSEAVSQQSGFTENFEDRNLTENPVWTGDLDDFGFVEREGNTLLRLDAEETPNRSQIRTASATAFGSWEFFIEVPATSNFNRAYIYLISDSDELDIVGSGSPSRANGYAIHTGSGRFDLVRIVNGSQQDVLISSDTEISPGAGYQVRVTRNSDAEWQLFVGEGYGSEPLAEGEGVTDDRFTESAWFGIYVRYTSGNLKGTVLDDIRVIPLEENDTENESDSGDESGGGDEDDSGSGTGDDSEGDDEGDSEGDGESDGDGGSDSGDESDGENEGDGEDEGDSGSDGDSGSGSGDDPDGDGEEDSDSDSDGDDGSDSGDESEGENDSDGESEGESDSDEDSGSGSGDESDGEGEGDSDPFQVIRLELLRADQLLLEFNREPDPQTTPAGAFVVNQGVGSPQQVHIEDQTFVRLEFSEPFPDGSYLLEMNGVADLNGVPADQDDALEFIVENRFEVTEFRFEGPELIEIYLSEKPDEALLTESDFEIDNSYSPNSIVISEFNDQWRISLRYQPSFSSGEYLFDAGSLRSEFGWPLKGETEFGFSVENPFTVTDLSVKSHSEIHLRFSSDLDRETVNPSLFTLSAGKSPSDAEVPESNLVVIRFEEPLGRGEYELSVSGLKSIEGWLLEAGMPLPFVLYDRFEPGDLLITEFYYRVPVSWRTDEFDRPQYLELYNRSEKTFSLRGYRLSGEELSPDQDLLIQPGEYLVLTRGKPVFEQRFGSRNFAEAASFPRFNLTTSGTVSLVTAAGEEVESFTYQASQWGGNGVALERYSLDLPASLRGNWTESEDPLTGSPGLPNSVSVPEGPPLLTDLNNPVPNQVIVSFSRDLKRDEVENPANFSLDPDMSVVSSEYDERNRSVKIITNRPFSDGISYRLDYSVTDIFGNRSEASVEFRAVNPFRAELAELVSDQVVRVSFTLPVDRNSVSADAFMLSDGRQPVSWEMPISSVVELTFASSFVPGVYELILNGLRSFDPDLEQQWNIETDTEVSFYKFDPYAPGDVLLTEFMYRGSEAGERYVEVHNRSAKWLNLSGWRLERRAGAPQIGGVIGGSEPVVLPPGGWLAIAEDVRVLGERFGEVAGVQMDRFPGFTVSQADQIRLLTDRGELADSLRYDPGSWGGNGVALERRSLGVATGLQANWAESQGESGGTPGQPNSVGIPETPAELLEVRLVNSEEVRVFFSRDLEGGSVAASGFELRPGSGPVSVGYAGNGVVEMQIEGGLTSGQLYELEVSGVRDLFGLEIARSRAELRYVDAEPALAGDVVISEFMYAPPQGLTRYVELYNRSGKWLDLSGWSQANDTGRRRVLTRESRVLGPGEYLVIAPDSTLWDRFEGIALLTSSSMPALKRGGDAIVIVNEQGMLIDSLRYSPSWGGDGVSLERRRPDFPGHYEENWGESPSGPGGTPGRANEVSREFAFAVTGIEVTGERRLQVVFNAHVDPGSLSGAVFAVNGKAAARAELTGERTVLVELATAPASGQAVVSVAGVRSAAGFTLPSQGQQVEVMIFDAYAPGDVLLTEFMYRGSEAGERYVEVHNRSAKWLNLSGWRLERRAGAPQIGGVIGGSEPVVLPPGGWLAIAEDVRVLGERFGEVAGVQMDRFPGFTVSQADQIRLLTDRGELADSLRYDPGSWGGNGVALER